MTQEDLWGALPKVESLRTPLVILKEQAELLQEKTEGLLVGNISQQQSGTQFVYHLSIIAPTLNNYTYELLIIIHDIGFYPLQLKDSQGNGPFNNFPDEEAYKQGLREIFSSEKNKAVISKLLTHITSQG